MINHQAYPSESDTCVLIKTSRNEMVINCTEQQYLNGCKKYYDGSLMQHAFPFLNDSELEFLISGCTPNEFDKMFPDE